MDNNERSLQDLKKKCSCGKAEYLLSGSCKQCYTTAKQEKLLNE